MRNPVPEESFEAYWQSYLSAHRKRGTRLLHYVGTLVGLAGGILAALIISPIVGGAIAIAGYLVALSGHFFIERNFPHARKPLWGFYADFRMLKRAITGELSVDLLSIVPATKDAAE